MNIHSLKIRTLAPMVIPIIILLIGLSVLSINKIKNILIEQAYSKLTTSRDIKKEQIESFFNRSVADIDILSKSLYVSDLISTLDNLDKYLKVKINKSYSSSNPIIKESIAPYKKFLQNYTNKYGYIDMLLISAQSGIVQYTQQAKISDFGENLKSGKLKDSALSEVWKKVKKLKRIVFVDMKPYLTHRNRPAIFVGAPVYKKGEFTSVLVLQISNHSISKIMNFKKGYEKSQTDQLIGGDYHTIKKGKPCASSYSLRASIVDPKIGRCNTKVSELALCGETGKQIVLECNQKRVLSAYTPVNLGKDLNWAIISEINEEEVLKVPNSLKNTAIRDFLILTSIIALVILFFIYKEAKYEEREAKKNQEMNETLQIRVAEEVVKNREQQKILFQQSKMASMGEMIGNIAHQWRQPLNALSALNVGLVMRYDAGKLSKHEMIIFKEKSNHLIQRMSDTIDDFRNFFHPKKSVEKFRVDVAINEAINFIKGSYSINNIKIINYSASKIEIRNHKNELIQVLLNIFNNSKDAIKEFNSENGIVIIDIIESERWLEITIQDNGGGIKQDIIDRVFEPYFTTKFKDDGTGIGLYMSKMIVEESMHGRLKIENREMGVLTAIKLPIN